MTSCTFGSSIPSSTGNVQQKLAYLHQFFQIFASFFGYSRTNEIIHFQNRTLTTEEGPTDGETRGETREQHNEESKTERLHGGGMLPLPKNLASPALLFRGCHLQQAEERFYDP